MSEITENARLWLGHHTKPGKDIREHNPSGLLAREHIALLICQVEELEKNRILLRTRLGIEMERLEALQHHLKRVLERGVR